MTQSQIGSLQQQVTSLQQSLLAIIDLHAHLLTSLQEAPPVTFTPSLMSSLEMLTLQLADIRTTLELSAPASETAGTSPSSMHTSELTVERINIIEPDGTLRMIIANAAREPDLIVDGKVIMKRDAGTSAGITFYNAEGDECGALVYGSQRQGDHHVASAGLFLDQYKQDEVCVLEYTEGPSGRRVGLQISDRSSLSHSQMSALMQTFQPKFEGRSRDELQALFEEAWQAGLTNAPRLFVGRDEARAAVIALRDERGRIRLQLRVSADGKPQIACLDDDGEITDLFPSPR